MTYVKSNPEIVESGDVCAQYNQIKNDDSSVVLYYIGIGCFILGLLLAQFALKKLIKG